MRTQKKILEAGRGPRVPRVRAAKAKPTNLMTSQSKEEGRVRPKTGRKEGLRVLDQKVPSQSRAKAREVKTLKAKARKELLIVRMREAALNPKVLPPKAVRRTRKEPKALKRLLLRRTLRALRMGKVAKTKARVQVKVKKKPKTLKPAVNLKVKL